MSSPTTVANSPTQVPAAMATFHSSSSASSSCFCISTRSWGRISGRATRAKFWLSIVGAIPTSAAYNTGGTINTPRFAANRRGVVAHLLRLVDQLGLFVTHRRPELDGLESDLFLGVLHTDDRQLEQETHRHTVSSPPWVSDQYTEQTKDSRRTKPSPCTASSCRNRAA